MTDSTQPLSIAIGSLGSIGLRVAQEIDSGSLPGFTLTAVSARDQEKATRNIAGFANKPDIVPLEALADKAEIVVECAPASVFSEIADPAVKNGRTFIPISVGALLRRPDLVDLAKSTGAQIIAPTGALIGLDAVRAANEGEIESVTLITRKPPNGLKGAPYLVENDVSVDGLAEAKLVFDGNAYDGAAGFPANVNVAAALSLAGIGPQRTKLQIWADPSVTRNMHSIQVEADSARFSMAIENVPTEENPKTGKITALSVIATLRRLTAPMTAGS